MALILPVNGVSPQLGEDCYIADNATIVGDVITGKNCSFWFNAVIRGDVNSIRIGDRTNVQDGAIIHCTYKQAATTIGSDVNIGHRSVVHGCEVGDHVLVGMGAIVMDHAVVEEYCIIAAGAVVLEKMVCERGHIYAGIPARKIKPISPDQWKLLDELPGRYQLYSSWFK